MMTHNKLRWTGLKRRLRQS